MKNPLHWIKSTETEHTGYSSARHCTDDDAIYLLQYEEFGGGGRECWVDIGSIVTRLWTE